MFGLGVPIITSVIGEGGSGGALAIGCGNKMLMLENAVYYVARYLIVRTLFSVLNFKAGAKVSNHSYGLALCFHKPLM